MSLTNEEIDALNKDLYHEAAQAVGEREIDALCAQAREANELRDKVFIPGYLKCDKCAFGGMFSNLNADSGNITPQDVSQRHVCPNDGSDLKPVTWRERANDWARLIDGRDETIRLQLEAAERTGRALADHVDQLAALRPVAEAAERYEEASCECDEHDEMQIEECRACKLQIALTDYAAWRKTCPK